MIEQGLAERASTSDRVVVETYRAATRRRRRAPVMILHDGAVLANAGAVELLEGADQAIFRELAEGATLLAPQVHRLELTSGIEVEIRLQAIEHVRGAVLFEIDRAPTGFSSSRSRPPAGDPLLPRELLDVRSSRAPALVAGEPGSGRTTIARSIAGDDTIHDIDSADLLTLGAETWLGHLSAFEALPGMVLIENVHLLPEQYAHHLSELLGRGTLWVTMTSAPITSVSGELAGLVARCVARTETVPLRRRNSEFGLVVRTMLRRLGADPSVRFTPETIEVLAAHNWPGNLRELSEVLREVLEHRSRGDVLPADLPVAYRRGARSRQLNRVQQFEHDAIVAALRANDGNKVAAAEDLGMSRSTLYRRIRALRVPDDM